MRNFEHFSQDSYLPYQTKMEFKLKINLTLCIDFVDEVEPVAAAALISLSASM